MKNHYISYLEISELLKLVSDTSNKLSIYDLNKWLKIETEGKYHILARSRPKIT